MMARLAVIVRKNLGPISIGLEAFPAQHRCIEVLFHPASPRAPDVEVAVAPRLENQEHDAKNTREQQGSGEAFWVENVTERAMPSVSTAQFVVASRRVRHIVLR